jgi:hypothetical protein
MTARLIDCRHVAVLFSGERTRPGGPALAPRQRKLSSQWRFGEGAEISTRGRVRSPDNVQRRN